MYRDKCLNQTILLRILLAASYLTISLSINIQINNHVLFVQVVFHYDLFIFSILIYYVFHLIRLIRGKEFLS